MTTNEAVLWLDTFGVEWVSSADIEDEWGVDTVTNAQLSLLNGETYIQAKTVSNKSYYRLSGKSLRKALRRLSRDDQ